MTSKYKGGPLHRCTEHLWSLMSLWNHREVMREVLGSGQHPGLPQGFYLIWWRLRGQRGFAREASLPLHSVEGNPGHAETCKGFLTEESRANPAMSQGFHPQLMQPPGRPLSRLQVSAGPPFLPAPQESHSHPDYCACVDDSLTSGTQLRHFSTKTQAV